MRAKEETSDEEAKIKRITVTVDIDIPIEMTIGERRDRSMGRGLLPEVSSGAVQRTESASGRP